MHKAIRFMSLILSMFEEAVFTIYSIKRFEKP